MPESDSADDFDLEYTPLLLPLCPLANIGQHHPDRRFEGSVYFLAFWLCVPEVLLYQGLHLFASSCHVPHTFVLCSIMIIN